MVLAHYTERAREAAELLRAWDAAHTTRQPARTVRRARLAYYDARFAFEGLAGAAVARQLIERALAAGPAHLRSIEGGAESCAFYTVQDLQHNVETAGRAFQIAVEAKAGPRTRQRPRQALILALTNLYIATGQTHRL